MEHTQHVVVEDPAEMAPAPAHCQDKHALLEEGSGRAPDSAREAFNQPAVAVGVPVPLQLPQGCAVGIPLAASFAAARLPEGRNLLYVAMNFVQADDYHGILELARCGAAHAMAEKRKCGFALALKPEDGAMSDLPVSLRVSNANLLHYAVCIGSFHAATALMVVNPELLRGTCRVVTSDGTSDTSLHEEDWCAAELARLFCVLYEGGNGDDEVLATRRLFEQALQVLELGDECPQQLPFINLPTVHERVAAAGWDPVATVQAFFAAASTGASSPMCIE